MHCHCICNTNAIVIATAFAKNAIITWEYPVSISVFNRLEWQLNRIKNLHKHVPNAVLIVPPITTITVIFIATGSISTSCTPPAMNRDPLFNDPSLLCRLYHRCGHLASPLTLHAANHHCCHLASPLALHAALHCWLIVVLFQIFFSSPCNSSHTVAGSVTLALATAPCCHHCSAAAACLLYFYGSANAVAVVSASAVLCCKAHCWCQLIVAFLSKKCFMAAMLLPLVSPVLALQLLPGPLRLNHDPYCFSFHGFCTWELSCSCCHLWLAAGLAIMASRLIVACHQHHCFHNCCSQLLAITVVVVVVVILFITIVVFLLLLLLQSFSLFF